MPRRALRKVDPNIDLGRHLYTFGQSDEFPAIGQLFSRSAPLEIEIGSGKGLFLTQAAADRPETNFVGIEIARKYAVAIAARLARKGLDNAVAINGDALRYFRERLPEASVAAVHVYFPDPWWKKRHRKRRVMNETFVRDIERVLVPGGRLHFWTDVEEYFHSTIDLIHSVSRLAGPIEVVERAAEHDLDYRTHFERRMRMHGEPVYRAEFVSPG